MVVFFSKMKETLTRLAFEALPVHRFFVSFSSLFFPRKSYFFPFFAKAEDF